MIALIGILDGDQVKFSTLKFDTGNLVGRCLKKNYTDPDKVNELISAGQIGWLGETIQDTIFTEKQPAQVVPLDKYLNAPPGPPDIYNRWLFDGQWNKVLYMGEGQSKLTDINFY